MGLQQLADPPRQPPRPGTRRHRILALVRREPGIPKSRLCQELGLAWSTVGRDVQQLLDERALEARRLGRSLHLYHPNDAPSLPSLALDHAAAIRAELSHGEASTLELARRLGTSQPIIQHRLDALEADGLVSSEGHAPRLYRRTDGR